MNIQRPLSKQPIPEKAKKVFKGEIFDVYQWDQEMFDGSFQIFEKLKRTDTVMVVPVTLEGKIILIEQEQPNKKHFISFPGGRVEEGENIENAANRELLEETGFKTDNLVFWDANQPVGKIDWSVYTFIAKNCFKVGEPTLDVGERIKLRLVSFEEFLEIVYDKDFDDLNIVKKITEAKIDPKKMTSLRKLLFGN